MRTIEIKNIYGDVLFSHTAENNTVKLTVEEAVKNDINLAGACLSCADLAGANLQGANLQGANLKGANLQRANLSDANFQRANLCRANLYRTNLNRANLYRTNISWANPTDASFFGANLEGANLEGANLQQAIFAGANLANATLISANLKDANLANADLSGADLEGADLEGANIYSATLDYAQNIPYIPLSCPSEGAFIGWKKVEGKYLVKLQIPEDARRTSATSRKCRCDKALVLDITSLDGNEHYDEVTNNNYNETIYKVGEMVYPDSFDENRWNECSNGIHFFVNKQDAINY